MWSTSAGFDRRPCCAEEDEVAGLELRERDPLCRLDLAAHRVGRAALEGRGERVGAGVGLQLVDAPDEAGAVEAARHLLAGRERVLRPLARPAPDVGVADEGDRRLEQVVLEAGHGRELERRGELCHPVGLPAAEGEDARGGEGGLGARGRVGGPELEGVLRGGVVDAETEQPRDDLGAEAAAGREPGGARAGA